VRRLAVLAGVLLVVAVVGVLVVRGNAGKGSMLAATSPLVAPVAADRHGPGSGPGAGENDVEPARASAVRAVALTDDVVRAGFISRRELIESFATADFGPTLADDTSAAVNAMLLELGERDVDPSTLAVVEQPITAAAESTDAGVRVRVWSVLVIAAPGTGPGRQAWRTVTLDMVDVDGRWLVDGWSSTPGPTPAPPPEGGFDDATGLAEPLGWPAATTPGQG
jgi:hypothetical protein